MEELNIKCYAHLGDAVYELFIREKIVYRTANLSRLHKINTDLVRASFQCEVLENIENYLSDKELDLVRRGRNLPSTTRHKNPNLHRIATGLEVLVGYLHLHNPERLKELFSIMSSYIESKGL